MKEEQLKKEVFLLEHGFYDEDIKKSLINWVKEESEECLWLLKEIKNIFSSPPYNESFASMVMSYLNFDESEQEKYGRLLATNKDIRMFWFKNKHPDEFKKVIEK